jgi:hypothetical protein
LAHKRGAPLGNQNARKHGFYSVVRTEAEKQNLSHAALVKGVDDEIALLRIKLRSVIEHDPENLELISRAVLSLSRLLLTRSKLVADLSLISSVLPDFDHFCTLIIEYRYLI